MLGNMPPKITAMLVMARERRLPLLDVLESCGIDALPACGCNEARKMLENQPVQVVVTDTALPDGDWRRVLETVVRLWCKLKPTAVARSCMAPSACGVTL
jgi:hypothetical protein